MFPSLSRLILVHLLWKVRQRELVLLFWRLELSGEKNPGSLSVYPSLVTCCLRHYSSENKLNSRCIRFLVASKEKKQFFSMSIILFLSSSEIHGFNFIDITTFDKCFGAFWMFQYTNLRLLLQTKLPCLFHSKFNDWLVQTMFLIASSYDCCLHIVLIMSVVLGYLFWFIHTNLSIQCKFISLRFCQNSAKMFCFLNTAIRLRCLNNRRSSQTCTIHFSYLYIYIMCAYFERFHKTASLDTLTS